MDVCSWRVEQCLPHWPAAPQVTAEGWTLCGHKRILKCLKQALMFGGRGTSRPLQLGQQTDRHSRLIYLAVLTHTHAHICQEGEADFSRRPAR